MSRAERRPGIGEGRRRRWRARCVERMGNRVPEREPGEVAGLNPREVTP